jgi:hypothetical protein
MQLDNEGRIQEHKITPGFIREAVKLTRDEVQTLIGKSGDQDIQRITLTVGGYPPNRIQRASNVNRVTKEQVEQLKTLDMLAQKREALRRKAGGVFFNIAKPDVEVWQNNDMPGLAWDHPHRLGRRVVEGDPILQMHTHKMFNWFSSAASPAQTLVTEMMLAAGEVAGMWCAERHIPTIYRGTVRRPDVMDAEVYLREVLEPATRASPTGEPPIHLGFEYVKLIGSGAMRTEPIRHGTLGLEHFGKVTSPLRRYGDMILHWQIEAALREEARSGKSLITDDKKADRSFLPFSRSVLETIMVGLQPREAMITRSKAYAGYFWVSMVMFRAFNFSECELPFATSADTSKPPMRVFIHAPGDAQNTISGTNLELNVHIEMEPPEKYGLPRTMAGDVWEAEINQIDVFRRATIVRPLRLVDRPAL